MKRSTAVALAVIVSLVGMSGCANPDDEATATQDRDSEAIVAEVEQDDSIAAMLPEDIQAKGEISAAINPEVAPIKFFDADGDIAGVNPDLLRAAAKVLGIEMNFQEVSTDSIIPGLESKRYDIIASIGDLVERQEKVDFIDYMEAGTAILTLKEFERDQLTREELCGLTIGYTRGSLQQAYLEQAVEQCKAKGEPEPNGVGYQESTAGVLAVKSGEDDGFWGDTPAVAYNVQKDPDLYKSVYSEIFGQYGIGVHKDDADLRDALRAALLKLVEDGVYDELMAIWGQQEQTLPEMPINSEVSEKDLGL